MEVVKSFIIFITFLFLYLQCSSYVSRERYYETQKPNRNKPNQEQKPKPPKPPIAKPPPPPRPVVK